MKALCLFLAPLTNVEHKEFCQNRIRYRHWGGVAFVAVETRGLSVGLARTFEGVQYTCNLSSREEWNKQAFTLWAKRHG